MVAFPHEFSPDNARHAILSRSSNPWLTLLTVLLWGAVALSNVPGLQLYVADPS
jgi:hypothetical protein